MTTDRAKPVSAHYGDRGSVQLLLACAGIVAPILLTALVLVLGWLEPGYEHRTQTISVLGGVGGIRGLLFNLGTVLTGLLLIAFAIGLDRGIGGGEGSKVGPILIILGGAGMLGSAVFHCNLGCTNILKSPTLAGRLHIIAAFLTGLSLAISPLVLFPRLWRDKQWRRDAWFGLAMGILANIPGLVLWASFFTTRIPAWEGVIQRLGILFPLVWVEVMAIHLLRRHQLASVPHLTDS